MSGLSRAAALLALVMILCATGPATVSGAVGRGAEFRLAPGMHADALAVGPDGNIWFAGTKYGPGAAVDVVGRATPGGQIAEFTLPTRPEAELGISSIAGGPGGALWFTEPNANRIGRVSTSGEISEDVLPNPGSRPRTIVAAPDGSLWFTEEGGDRVARYSPVVDVLRERQLMPGARPTGIAARADGTIWVAEPGLGSFATVATVGVTTFHLPFPRAQPNAVVPGPEGHVWMTEESGPWIYRITSVALTKGRYERLRLPTEQGTRWLVFGPSGDFWYTSGNRIGSQSPDYFIAGPDCLAAGCDVPVTALVGGPEENLWFASGIEPGGDRLQAGTIGKFLPPIPVARAIRSRPLAGRHVKLEVSCQGGAAGEFCAGRLQVFGRLSGRRGLALLSSRGVISRVHSDRDFTVALTRPAAAQLRREGRLQVRVNIALRGGRHTSGHLVLRAGARKH